MILDIFIIVLPLFIVIIAGFLMGFFFKLNGDSYVRVVTDFFMPLLVFDSLYNSTIEGSDVLNLLGATVFVVLSLMVLSIIYLKIFNLDLRSFMPPVIFMNSGFLGIPLMKLWGGMAAMNSIVIYDQIQTFLIFTLGILIVTGGFSVAGLKEMIKSPLLWAIVLGFVFRFSSLSLPGTVMSVFSFGGVAAPPLAAFALGASLTGSKIKASFHIISGLLLRFVGGFLAGMAAVYIFGIGGLLKTVVLVASSLPSAVFSFILPLRYGVEPGDSGAMVLISTALGVFTIPLAFTLAALLQ